MEIVFKFKLCLLKCQKCIVPVYVSLELAPRVGMFIFFPCFPVYMLNECMNKIMIAKTKGPICQLKISIETANKKCMDYSCM